MASYKSLILVCFMAAATTTVRGQIIGDIIGVVNGNLFCTSTGNPINGSVANIPFPGATVQLLGILGITVGSAVTNSSGGFSFIVPLLFQPITSFLNSTLRVVTPLAACNSSLSPVANALSSTLLYVRNTTNSLGTTIFSIPLGFQVNVTIA